LFLCRGDELGRDARRVRGEPSSLAAGLLALAGEAGGGGDAPPLGNARLAVIAFRDQARDFLAQSDVKADITNAVIDEVAGGGAWSTKPPAS
jgi:hypothetical protein